jgi:prephenate dehydrogenase
MKTVAIIGLGMIGGSLGQALRRSKKYKVIGIARRTATLRDARRLGAIDQGSLQLEDIGHADIVVIATPVSQIVPMVERIKPFLRPRAIVTDVGSVKLPIVAGVSKRLHFVGSHPLAGSHRTGVRAANGNLFKNSACVIVPTANGSAKPVRDMWRAVGARPRIMSASAHDEAVAAISHLPHVLAHAMVHLVLKHTHRPKLLPLLAGSFRDLTRVAGSDARQWAEILNANRPEVKRVIAQFRKELSVIEKRLGSAKLARHLSRSQRFRLPLFQSKK